MIFWIIIAIYLCIACFSVFNCTTIEEEMSSNIYDNRSGNQTISYVINPINRNI